MRTVEVAAVERLTPHMVRVTLSGQELDGFELRGPAGHVRLFFPRPGEDLPVIPERDENGRWPEGVERPVSRVYTPRRFDDAAKRLDVDVVLHEGSDGPGSTWARDARPGSRLVVAGPSGPYVADPAADWYLIAADHAGLPAVATIVESLPAGKDAYVYVEVPDAADELPLPSPASLHVTWVHGGHAAPGQALAAALKTTEPPHGDGRVFVACEAGAMREIKRNLLQERGLNREHVYTHGYWQRGEANHPDHDLAPEI
jgi:NADPH-dependent ferric siderophore reductase